MAEALSALIARTEQLDRLRRRHALLRARLRQDQARSWSDLTTRPVSDRWGADRGRCVDRFYIEDFLRQHADDIRGRVLEVHDDDYTKHIGRDRVTEADVVDVDPRNAHATIVADLRHAPHIPPDRYDCIILTQTLHFIFQIRAVLGECHRILRPGGILLATLPCVSRIAPEQGLDSDFWRFTAASARRLFGDVFPDDAIEVHARGNVAVSIAFLHGLACEEVEPGYFELNDLSHPLIITVRARRPTLAE